MDRAVDILDPLTSLEWKECRGPPGNVTGARAVWLKDKVYVGGGVILGNRRSEARLYIYTPATDEWTTLDTPVYSFGLTTYHSQLVLVGGWKYVGENIVGEPTNKLWTLSEDGQWQETLPPMPTPCTGPSAVSHGDHLLVINNDNPNKVYVYNGHHWASAQHPPQGLVSIKSTIFNGDWYVIGWGGIVYSASLDSLLASCQPSETSQPSSLWKRLTDAPSGYCYPAVFGNRLVAVERRSTDTTFTTSLYAYSSLTQSWVHMGDAPISSTSILCAVPLPSNELMIVSGLTAFRVRLTLTPFDPENSFTLRAVSLLESAAGIPVMTTLSDYTHRIQNILDLPTTTDLDLNGVLNSWISGVVWLPPSWRNLLQIIRLLHQDELAQRMETYLSAGATEELSLTRGRQGDKEVEEQIRLNDDVIFQLKQRIADLEYRNKELKEISQISIKKEVKTEPKEEPFTLEREPHVVKREIREEAVPMTKAETTSAQPTTATWNLRGVEVCGEMTVVIHSSRGKQITWPGYGLRLNIPKGCLPAGMEQCTIYIKASLAGQYEFPENSHLVSAIFWLRCEDVRKFTKSITMEIQHCAKSDNITNLSFVRAVCSQKQLPYTFKQLPGGNFTSHSSYGVIELNSFSGVGVIQEGSEDREYCSQLFYLGQPYLCKIHFVISWNVEAHLTEITKKYKEEGAILGVHQLVEFEADTISLDIPMEGLSIKGWKITPLMRPVVTKKQVDNFREGKLTPCCQLKAEIFGRRKKIPRLSHQVKLEGAKYPYNVFTIDLPAEDPNSQPAGIFGDFSAAGPPPSKRSRHAPEPSASGSSTADPSSTSGLDTKLNTNAGHFAPSQQPISVSSSTVNHSTHTVLTSGHYASLIQQLSSHAAKWREIGNDLGFSANELDVVQSKPVLLTEAPTSWLQEILSQWLEWAPGDSRGSTSFATLENLKTALSRAGLGATAYHLQV